MKRIMVAGIGTDVGKTVVSAVLTHLLQADYWKPFQCGAEEMSDSVTIKNWINIKNQTIHPSAYSFKAPLSPHHAASLESIEINFDLVKIPETKSSLIIEGVGGVFVPLTRQSLSIDLFKEWNCRWIIVSKHYLGSINHTLLTIEALKKISIPILGIIFNGEINHESEAAILNISNLPFLGRLLPEKNLNLQTIQRYAEEWYPSFSKVL